VRRTDLAVVSPEAPPDVPVSQILRRRLQKNGAEDDNFSGFG